MFFSPGVLVPLLVLMTEDGASAVDLITSTREVDMCHIGEVTKDGVRMLFPDACDTTPIIPKRSTSKDRSPMIPPEKFMNTEGKVGDSVKKDKPKKTPAKAKAIKTPVKTPEDVVKGIVSLVNLPETTTKTPKSTAKSTAKKGGKRKAADDAGDEEEVNLISVHQHKYLCTYNISDLY